MAAIIIWTPGSVIVNVWCDQCSHSSCNSSQGLFFEWRIALSRILSNYILLMGLSSGLWGGSPSFFLVFQTPSVTCPFELDRRIFDFMPNKNNRNRLNVPPTCSHEFSHWCVCIKSLREISDACYPSFYLFIRISCLVTLLLSPSVLLLWVSWKLAGLNLILIELTATVELFVV